MYARRTGAQTFRAASSGKSPGRYRQAHPVRFTDKIAFMVVRQSGVKVLLVSSDHAILLRVRCWTRFAMEERSRALRR